MKFRPHTLLLLLLLAGGCRDAQMRMRDAFAEHESLCLMVGGDIPFTYDPLNCQIAFSRDRKEFRAHSDTMSDFYAVTLSEIPTEAGQRVTADLVWTTERDVLTRKNLTLEVVRVEGDQFWLWSRSGRIGLMLRVLD